MVNVKSTMLPLALALTLTLGVGCKKEKRTPSAKAPAVSPVGNAPASATPLSAGVGRDPGQKPGAAVKDWRHEDEKKAKKKQSASAAVSKAATEAVDEEGPTEEEKRRKALEKKVDSTLGGAMGALKRCFETGGESGGKVTLRFRVHRSGYVLSPSLSGVGASSAACARGVIGKMKISGNDVGTVDMVRTLKFERRTVPR